jgi:hypothetical protein
MRQDTYVESPRLLVADRLDGEDALRPVRDLLGVHVTTRDFCRSLPPRNASLTF